MDILKKLKVRLHNPGGYCGAHYQSKLSKNRLPSLNPATASAIADVAPCTMADYETIMERLQQAFLIWRETPAPKRGDVIREIAQRLRCHKDALGSLVSLEMGKPKHEGDAEVQEMIDMADFAVGQSRMLYGKTMHSERPEHRMYEQWHPYGIVGVISAFNFPVAVWAWNAFIAAICGNVTLWKPSHKTPLCAIAVHHLVSEVLRELNCPDIFALIIPGSHAIANAMVEDPRIPVLSFTGSTAVGKQVAVKVAARFGHAILELGGNNAVILDKTADLSLAIPAVVFGAIATAGQRCTSTRRLLIHQSIYAKVLQQLKKAYAKVTIGTPLNPKNLMGPLIDAKAVLEFQLAVDKARAFGGRVVVGGSVLPFEGYYVEPTLIEGLDPTCPLMQEETFAPILYLMPFDTVSEAIRIHNAVPQGLSSALFTQNLKVAEQFLSASGSDCGIANINIGTCGAEIGGAFGGEKATGGGREAGSDAWKAYMRRQTNTIHFGDASVLAQGLIFRL